MSRPDGVRKSKHDRLPAAHQGVPSWVRAVPWLALAQAGLAVGRRWLALSAKERSRLTRLARESHGWPGNLSRRERVELRRLVIKLDLGGMARELRPLKRRGRRRRGCR